jgi:signal transduction histidine kinase
MSGRRLGFLALVVSALLALAGCGGDDDEGSADDWATSVCTNLSEWITDVDSAAQSLTEEGLGSDADDVRAAFDEASNATDELADDLEQLGAPETENGQQAKEELDDLREGLREQIETIERALDEDRPPLDLAATVAAAVSTATNQLKQTFQNLEGLDPGGELEDAFMSSDECDSLREQLEDIGS